MAAHLVTGYKGEEHIQSADQGSFNASFFGVGQYVMEAGNQMEASIVDNNTVRIVDGDILMKGRHIRINPNTYEDITIDTGTAGTYRNDLIVMRYEKNNSTGVETASLVVIKGTETEGTPSDPSYTDGDILAGALLNDMPLYRVKIEGVVLSELETMFSTLETYAALAEHYEREFITACQTHLDSLNILDTKEEIEANTQPNQLAGALAVKEVIAALGDAATVRYDPETDMIQIYDGTTWHDWKSGGLISLDLLATTAPADWIGNGARITSEDCKPMAISIDNGGNKSLTTGASISIAGYNRLSISGTFKKIYSSGCWFTIKLIGKNTGTTYLDYEAVKASDTSTGYKQFERTVEIEITEDCYVQILAGTTTGATTATMENIYFHNA